MARAITVRQIDTKLHAALRQRAAKAGRSVEAEVRAKMRTAGRPQTDSALLIREGRDER